jgi:hypothetical protein
MIGYLNIDKSPSIMLPATATGRVLPIAAG